MCSEHSENITALYSILKPQSYMNKWWYWENHVS
jgi:hypothetical protein